MPSISLITAVAATNKRKAYNIVLSLTGRMDTRI